jgi:hypothetical protein
MKLFYSHNGVKLVKKVRNNCLLFLGYFWYFFPGLFSSRIRFFLEVIDSKQLNQNKKK